MSLERYTLRCSELANELEDELLPSDIDSLRGECAAIGLDNWYGWLNKHLKTVSAIVGQTPSRRRSRAALRDPKSRRMFVLAGIWYLRRAEKILRVIDDQRLYPGDSYRQVAARAGNAYIEVVYRRDRDWPFDDPDPFAKE